MVNTNLADVLAGLADNPRIPGPTCGAAVILGSLDPDTRTAMIAAMQNRGIRHSQIADALTAHGHPVKAGTISRHRRFGTATGCRCTTIDGGAA